MYTSTSRHLGMQEDIERQLSSLCCLLLHHLLTYTPTCAHTRPNLHRYRYRHRHRYRCKHRHRHRHTGTGTQTQTQAHTCTQIQRHTPTHTRTNTHVRARAHIHIYTYVHTLTRERGGGRKRKRGRASGVFFADGVLLQMPTCKHGNMQTRQHATCAHASPPSRCLQQNLRWLQHKQRWLQHKQPMASPLTAPTQSLLGAPKAKRSGWGTKDAMRDQQLV